jgi:hypothetical protein
MKRRFLEDCLAKGMSLEAIGELAGRHPQVESGFATLPRELGKHSRAEELLNLVD